MKTQLRISSRPLVYAASRDLTELVCLNVCEVNLKQETAPFVSDLKMDSFYNKHQFVEQTMDLSFVDYSPFGSYDNYHICPLKLCFLQNFASENVWVDIVDTVVIQCTQSLHKGFESRTELNLKVMEVQHYDIWSDRELIGLKMTAKLLNRPFPHELYDKTIQEK